MNSLEDMLPTAANESASLAASVDPAQLIGPQRDELYIVIPVTIIYVMIFVTGLIGNIFTCFVIVKNKTMHTATNYYLFSLALSDLLLLLSGIPQEVYYIWSRWPYVFGPSFCWLRGLASETSTNASVLTITLFTVERYLAICHPFMSHRMSNLTRAIRHVCLVWVVSLILALPPALQLGITYQDGIALCLQTRVILEHSFEISTFVFFLAPMILISILYSLIGLRLKKARNEKEMQEQALFEYSRNQSTTRRNPHAATKRVVKMLVAVVVAFFVCWAPFHAQRLVAIYGTDENNQAKSKLLLKVYAFLTYISGVFYYMSTCINPIFYHIMSNKFRDAFKVTINQLCCRRHRHDPKQYSYTAIALGRIPSSLITPNSGSIRVQRENSNSLKNKRKYVDEANGHAARDSCHLSDDNLLIRQSSESDNEIPACKRRRSATMSEIYSKLTNINECQSKRRFVSTIEITSVKENNNKTI
ncbi:pyrokinin-1 receptor-like [Plodia interpunctella]|uniref:pyrokinin-1 receptor-like n=1 Tax=Plodia interpunctella TaxID=58824 RepID=UPI002368EEAC|nr:pyrokinin-1 receptor-like [Plodia interpunctella]XP_053613156.1 pyrokinin-1 receptor-like [Plodia interpunctella]